MKIVPIKDKLDELGLEHPTLNVLQANETLYTAFVVQPQGKILVTHDSIGHEARGEAEAKMSSFLRQASTIAPAPDLVICPEYSLPWNVLTQAIEEGIVPASHKLWVLGCESLKFGRLAEIRGALADKVVIIDDESSAVDWTTQKYRNPLVYLFKTPSKDDSVEKLVMVVQYKTSSSGDNANTEPIGMQPGRIVYRFGGRLGEVNLMTLICSDAFSFTQDLCTSVHDRLLLLHIQLNNNPRHLIYKRYRQYLFELDADTELLCLNWAEQIQSTEAPGGPYHHWKNIGGSAWYTRAPEFDTSDSATSTNHRAGIYYTRHQPFRTHVLQFDYRERAFLLQATKVFHHGVPKAKSKRTGPKAQKTFYWAQDEENWVETTDLQYGPDDGFKKSLGMAAARLPDIVRLHDASPLALERVLAITAGELETKSDWHEIENIDSVRIGEDEHIKRVTFAQDPTGVRFRLDRIKPALAVATLRENGYEWPVELEKLGKGFEFTASPSPHQHRNVIAHDGTLMTVVHLGEIPDQTVADTIDQKLRKIVAGSVSEPDRVLSEGDMRSLTRQHQATAASRYCLLYVEGNKTVAYKNTQKTSISQPVASAVPDFTAPSLSPIA